MENNEQHLQWLAMIALEHNCGSIRTYGAVFKSSNDDTISWHFLNCLRSQLWFNQNIGNSNQKFQWECHLEAFFDIRIWGMSETTSVAYCQQSAVLHASVMLCLLWTLALAYYPHTCLVCPLAGQGQVCTLRKVRPLRSEYSIVLQLIEPSIAFFLLLWKGKKSMRLRTSCCCCKR